MKMKNSKKMIAVLAGILAIFLICVIGYFDGGKNAGVYTTAVTVIGTVCGIHNWRQSIIDAQKNINPDHKNEL